MDNIRLDNIRRLFKMSIRIWTNNYLLNLLLIHMNQKEN